MQSPEIYSGEFQKHGFVLIDTTKGGSSITFECIVRVERFPVPSIVENRPMELGLIASRRAPEGESRRLLIRTLLRRRQSVSVLGMIWRR